MSIAIHSASYFEWLTAGADLVIDVTSFIPSSNRNYHLTLLSFRKR